jgi:glyoxylase-like metal-dependent hydrolase (beta-lactamase superfamily II)
MVVSRRNFIKASGTAALVLGVAPMSLANSAETPSSGPGVDVYAFLCGVLKTQTQYMLKDTRIGTPMDIPVPFYIIRHGSDWVAFDTGNNGRCAVDPVVYWGKAVSDAYMPVMKPYEEFKEQIKRIGLTPKMLHAVILSHGHLDHSGAIEDLAGTDVPVYIQKDEWETVKKAIASGVNTAYIPADFTKIDRVNMKTIEGAFDVFGDHSVVVFPTPGHTPGHQSVCVHTNDGQSLILAQDACYTLENMVANIPPGLAFDIPKCLVNTDHFRVMTYNNMHLVPAHDPDWWKGKPLAPQTLKV